jgi:hypothetical protein
LAGQTLFIIGLRRKLHDWGFGGIIRLNTAGKTSALDRFRT